MQNTNTNQHTNQHTIPTPEEYPDFFNSIELLDKNGLLDRTTPEAAVRVTAFINNPSDISAILDDFKEKQKASTDETKKYFYRLAILHMEDLQRTIEQKPKKYPNLLLLIKNYFEMEKALNNPTTKPTPEFLRKFQLGIKKYMDEIFIPMLFWPFIVGLVLVAVFLPVSAAVIIAALCLSYLSMKVYFLARKERKEKEQNNIKNKLIAENYLPLDCFAVDFLKKYYGIDDEQLKLLSLQEPSFLEAFYFLKHINSYIYVYGHCKSSTHSLILAEKGIEATELLDLEYFRELVLTEKLCYIFNRMDQKTHGKDGLAIHKSTLSNAAFLGAVTTAINSIISSEVISRRNLTIQTIPTIQTNLSTLQLFPSLTDEDLPHRPQKINGKLRSAILLNINFNKQPNSLSFHYGEMKTIEETNLQNIRTIEEILNEHPIPGPSENQLHVPNDRPPMVLEHPNEQQPVFPDQVEKISLHNCQPSS